VRIENSCELGTPDVNGRVAWCVDWWIELKYSKAWPKRPRTVVRLEHFTREQKQWLVDRGKVGGCCGVLWQVGSEYLFFDWRAAPYLGTLTRAELYECALWHGKSLGEEVFRGFLERGI
jgi:hypothetical protein